MKTDTIKKNMKEFIVEKFLFGDGEKLEYDTSFLEQGIIDSTGVLEIVHFLEESFSVQVEDDEMLPENLDSINYIANYLQKKLNKKSVK